MVKSPMKVRCTVCNAVFDASLDVCPVCGAKRDRFVPVEDEAPAAKEPAKKVRCTVCNAVFDASLDVCPVCGAKRDRFVPVEDAPAEKPPKKPAAGPGRVRCLICGEILDAGTEVCPVCGAGKESLVPYVEEARAFRRDTDERFLIIGGGAAAYNAAKAIRERNKTCAIVILAQEEDPPYNRPMLTKTLLDDFHCDQIAICPRSWYEEQNITLLTGVAATAVDPENKRVTTDSGAVVAYDKLIYAAGARCFRPPIPGIDLDNVITLRGAKDALKVESLLPGVKNAVVIGGGVLGIEAAWELRRAGANVTVVETAPRIMPRQLDDGAARTLSMIMEKKGIALRTGATVCRIDGAGKAERVVLKSGEEFPADLVIVSTGIVPNAEVLAAAGANVNRAVVVDSHMRTSLPDVYAAGDCAVCGGVNFALWAQAVDMGRVAGANAAGEEIEYYGITGALTLNALDTSLYAVGEHGESGAYRAEEVRDDDKGFYEKRYFRGDRLAGFILIGDLSRLAEYNMAYEQGRAGI
jgi:NAD(P)H-nitrite reductase large subunit/rubrerythrin